MTRTQITLLAPLLLVGLYACGKAEAPSATPGSEAVSPAAPAHADNAAKPLPAGHPPLPAAHPPAAKTTKTATTAAPVPKGPAQAGGLTWDATAPLLRRAPGSGMRAAEYGVAGAGDLAEATLTVYYFGPGQGGSIQGNLDRWIGQLSQKDGSSSKEVAKTNKQDVGGMTATTLDVSGTFGGGMAPKMAGKQAATDNYRMLGGIVEGPQGPVFFKLVGPAPTVATAEQAFASLIGSVHAQ